MERSNPVDRNNPHGSTPVPDPTLLTTAALTREIAALKELMATRLDAMDKAQALYEINLTRVPTDVDKQIQHLKELVQNSSELKKASLEERLNGFDKVVDVLTGFNKLFSDLVVGKVTSLQHLQDEKFASIGKQFQERDVWAAQQKKDNEVSVGAALQAAKEAVGEQNKSSSLAISKSEASTTKQIDQLGQLIQSGNQAMDSKINDLKERVGRIEGQSTGVVVADKSHLNSNNQLILIVSVLIALASLFFGIYEATVKHT